MSRISAATQAGMSPSPPPATRRAFRAGARRPSGRAGRGRAGSGRSRSRRCRRSRAPSRRPYVRRQPVTIAWLFLVSRPFRYKSGTIWHFRPGPPPETCNAAPDCPAGRAGVRTFRGGPRRLTRVRLLPAAKNGLLIGLVLCAGMLAGCSTTRLEPAISPLSELGADTTEVSGSSEYGIVLPDEVAVVPSSYAGPTPTEGAVQLASLPPQAGPERRTRRSTSSPTRPRRECPRSRPRTSSGQRPTRRAARSTG